MNGYAIIPLLAVAIGVMCGLLMANNGHPDRSPWPYITGLVGLAVVAAVATWH